MLNAGPTLEKKAASRAIMSRNSFLRAASVQVLASSGANFTTRDATPARGSPAAGERVSEGVMATRTACPICQASVARLHDSTTTGHPNTDDSHELVTPSAEAGISLPGDAMLTIAICRTEPHEFTWVGFRIRGVVH